jgi:Protein of unknown function (DUF3592)
MKAVVIGVFLILLPLFGSLTFYLGLQGLWTTVRRRPFLYRAEGEVIAVQKKDAISSPYDGDTSTLYTFQPVLRFTTESGEVKEFTSATGKGGTTSPYILGMKIPVLYDAEEIMPPTIDSWFDLWGGHLLCVAGGLVFFGGCALVYVAFGQDLFSSR